MDIDVRVVLGAQAEHTRSITFRQVLANNRQNIKKNERKRDNEFMKVLKVNPDDLFPKDITNNRSIEMNDDYSLDEISSGESGDLLLPHGSITNEVEPAPSFYQQMQNEIQVLRNKVDRQLSDMVLSSTLELKTLTDQMKNLKEKDNQVATQQSMPSRRAGHPSSPGSLRDLASPRNRPQQPVSAPFHSNALSITSSVSSRLREDASRDITEPTTNLTRYANRQHRRKPQFEAQSTTSSTSLPLDEVVSHDVTEPTTNLTRHANHRQVQTEKLNAGPSMSKSESSSVCKEIVICSQPRSASTRLSSSPTEQGIAVANDRLGQINEVEDEDESFVEQNEPTEYEEIHEVNRRQQKSSRRRSIEQPFQPLTKTKPSSTRRGAAYEKYRTLNRETLLRPWRQKKSEKHGTRKDGEYDDKEHLSCNKSDYHQNTKYDLHLVQMVSSDDVSTPHPEEGLDPSRSMSPIYDKAQISVQHILPSDNLSELNQNEHSRNRSLSPGERVYRQHESQKKGGMGTHWNIFSMRRREVDLSVLDRGTKVEELDEENPNNLTNEHVASAVQRRVPESTAILEKKSPRRSVIREKSPGQSNMGETMPPTRICERTSPVQTLSCGTTSPRQTTGHEKTSQRQIAIGKYKSPRQIDAPPDTKPYNEIPQRQYDPPSTVEHGAKLLPTNNEKLLRAALATSDQCAITIYPPTGVYHDAIVLKTYNAEEEEKKEEERALVVRSNGERRVRLEQVETKTVQDPYGDYGVFTGLLLKGLPYGQGTMAYADGRTYVGEWRSGRWHGQGKTTFSNGDVYVGEYYMDKRHGIGRYEWKDGRIYDGEFKNNQREGKGTYSFPDSSVYSGDFHKGLRHGQGCYKFADLSLYNGGFKNGKYDGVGECIWAGGRCYRGEWKDGWAHGYGVEMRADGSIRHDGEWKRDKPVRKTKDDSRRASRIESHDDGPHKTKSETERYTVVYRKEEISLQSSSELSVFPECRQEP